jgi:phenylacetate-CoA ligase
MTGTPQWQFASAIPGAAWPAVPAAGVAGSLALLHQLERSQWLGAQELVALQLRQLGELLRHAYATVPAYASAWAGLFDADAPLTMDAFRRLPVLTRRQLQERFAGLRSTRPLPEHGSPQEGRSSGSTGAPVRYLTTGLTALLWNAFTLRDHLWHRRDLGLKLAVIRRETTLSDAANWGPATAGLVATGRCVSNSIREDAGALLDWLLREQPAYLFTYPSLVAEMARLSLRRGVRPAALLEVRTLAEALDPELRSLCREAWGVPLTDLYSASEAGYLALQCPRHEHYHVQSEGVLLEVLDAAGAPCAPGEVGRVVVTPLHNFAMPLVRYDIGDYAEAGGPCDCGRGLPVLKRILGRVRNVLVTADGKRYWPAFGMLALSKIAPVLQHQFVQKSYELVEARLVLGARLTAAQEAQFRAHIQSLLPPGMRVELVCCDRIERSASGKFEDLVSEVSAS